jgi:hypothetical protein
MHASPTDRSSLVPQWSSFVHNRWECVGPAEDPSAELYATVEIEGCPFHLNAIRIVHDEGSVDALQKPDPASGYTSADFVQLSSIFGDSGPWVTVLINGREYVVWPEPFSA